jgi:hypothetical protein
MRLRMSLVLSALFLVGLLPVVTSGAADAVPMRAWNRLAHCESGGRWHIATGNGYFGGLQFSASTWRAFGGKKYASSAHRASPSEQVRVAERVRRSQGWGAWPSCSRQVGLR